MTGARVKRGVEAVLARGGAAGIGRVVSRSRALVLAYHDVVPDGCPARGDASLHLPLSRFIEQLDALARTHEVVPLAEIVEGASGSGTPRRPRVAITFDDAYRGAVTVAIPELVKRGMPATVFVAPAFIGGRSFWWDALAAPGGIGLTTAFRDMALGVYRGEDGMIRSRAGEHGMVDIAVERYSVAASEDELERAAGQPGITLGSHTWSHPNLAALSGAALRRELVEPLQWLRDRFDAAVPYLAYPYGLASREAARIAAEVGYTAAFRVSGGSIPARRPDRYALPRLNVPAGLSRDGFVLRTSGWFQHR